MPIPSINFANIPVQRAEKPDYSGLENLIPNFLKSYHEPQKLAEERQTAARKKEAEELANRFLNDYGEKHQKAKLALLEAQAGYYNRLPGEKSSSGGLGTEKERRILWNGLGPDAKAEEYRRGSILGWSPSETQQNFIKGITPESEAESKGIDIKNETGHYLAPGSSRAAIVNAGGIEKELGAIQDYMGNDLKYFGKLGGMNELFDSLTGRNKEERLRALGARAMQAELNAVRAKYLNGSSAHEALEGMQRDALARVSIFEPGISGEDRQFVQDYIHKGLQKAYEARKRGVMGARDNSTTLKKDESDPLGLL